MAQTHMMEFPRPGTPESEKIIVCEKCYHIVKIWMLLCLNWEAEKELIHGLSDQSVQADIRPLYHQIYPIHVQVPRRRA